MTATVEIETIGPDRATQMLGHNTHNRNLRQPYVERLARSISDGDWQFNGETIKFATDGSLLDGQHRLAAVVEAGQPIKTAVIYDLEPDGQMTVDVGVRRNFGDVLRLNGHHRYAVLAATLSWQFRYENGTFRQRKTNVFPTAAEGLRVLAAHPDLPNSIPAGEAISRVLRVQPSLAAFLHYTFASINSEDADDFFSKMAEPVNLSDGSPILALRRKLELEMTGVAKRNNSVGHAALFIKAWNAYRDGRPVERLHWSGGGAKPEAFPVPA